MHQGQALTGVDSRFPFQAAGVSAEYAATLSVASDRTPSRMWRLVRKVLLLTLIAFAIRTFLGEASVVPTPSMEGTILVGDHLLINKASYGPEIPFTGIRLPALKRVKRGEMVVFHFPRDLEQSYLKRVIAMSGDVVEIRRGVLYVNGNAIYEPYLSPRNRMPVYEHMSVRLVPAGHIFVMGDNRNNSSDSRSWGTVPVANVIGEPLMIVWSYDAPTAAWLDDNLFHKLRFYGSIVTHLVAKTRWDRTGTLL